MTVYLACLEFRTPPFTLQFRYPNAQMSVPIVLDGAFAFLNKYSGLDDWREEYLTDALGPIVHETQDIKTSYILPAVGNQEIVKFITPLETCLVFKINDKAVFKEISNDIPPIVPFSLRLNRRFALDKALSLETSTDNFKLSRKRGKIAGISSIYESRGPFKSISLDLKINACNLFWCVFVDTDNPDVLRNYLEYLRISGIGKKRNMGWGDLKMFCIYEMELDNSIQISVNELIYTQNNEKVMEMIRPRELREIRRLIQNKKYSLLKILLGHGAVDPPYWGKDTVVYCAKLRMEK
jgi:hypothetical protein